jgi:hypothetical protein
MHQGYGPAGHRRSVIHAARGGWLILDEVVGRGRHARELHWHFDPAWDVTCESKARLRLIDPEGRVAWLLHDEGGLTLARGDAETGLGWCAPVYGRIVPTWTARFTHAGAPGAGTFTWFSGTLADPRPPVMERLRMEHDPAAAAAGVRVRHGEYEELVVLRPGDVPRRDPRACSIAEFHTDARLLHAAFRDRRLVALALADGAHALALADGLISLAADGGVDDLHAQFDRDSIELTATVPPPRLQVQGAAVSRVRTVRANGREIPVLRPGRVDTIVIHAADWATPAAAPRTTTCVA